MKAEDIRSILHIAPTPFFSNRGCHIRIKNIIDALTSQGISSVVCSYHLGDTPEGIDVRRTPSIPGYTKRGVGFSPYKFPADVLLFLLCLKVVWTEKPSVIYGHLHEGALIGWALKIMFFWRSMVVIMDMQGSLSGELRAYGTFDRFPIVLRLFRWLENLIYKLPKVITCSSVGSRQSLIDDFNLDENKCVCLPDVIGAGFFARRDSHELREKLGLPSGEKIVIYTGSLLQGKGVDILYDALKAISGKRDDCHFLLVGYPIEGAKAFIDSNKLGTRCTLTGEVEYGHLAEYLALGDVAVDPKEQDSGEASGKILHYMAAGLPVVCFDFPNNRALLAEHGYYTDVLTSDGLALKIEEVLGTDNIQAQGQKLKVWAEDKFSVANSGRLLQDHVLNSF